VDDGVAASGARFFGTFEHALDAKGRLILPARFRDGFGAGGYLGKLHDGCLAVWPAAEFERRADELIATARQGQAQRNVARSLAAGAFEVSLDAQGRIPIPPPLRDFAALESEVVVNGAINHVELWNPERWRAVDAEGSQGLLSGRDSFAEIGF